MKQAWLIFAAFLLVGSSSVAEDIDDAISARDAGQFQKSINLLLPLARNDDVRAQYELGISSNAVGDEDAAFNWLELAAKSGHSDAALMLGLSYMHEDRTKEEEDKGLIWIQTAAATGDELAETILKEYLSLATMTCTHTPASQISSANWIVYDDTDEMTDEANFRLVSKTISLENNASFFLEIDAKDIRIRASRSLDRNLDKQIGVRVDSGPYYAADSFPVKTGSFTQTYNATGLWKQGIITREQLLNITRTGNIDGFVPDPPNSLIIVFSDRSELSSLIEEMKNGNRMKVRIILNGQRESTIITLSLVGFTQAYKDYQSCLDRVKRS